METNDRRNQTSEGKRYGNLQKTICRYNETKASIRICIESGINKLTSREIRAKYMDWIDGFKSYSPKRTPKSFYDGLMQYAEGYFDASVKGKTVFLYNVDGKFYRTEKDKDIDLPVWSELPRNMWDKLGDHGGIYWKATLNPFFIH